MINNRDCFFYKKSDFINRLQDISPDSVCYIADTQQIYTHGRYFECNVTQAVVEQLIQNHGYLTAADLPVLTGGASPTPGEYVTGVSVGGHNVNVQKGKLSEINVGTASKLETPRKIELSGDLSGSIMFDGSQDVNIETIVHNSTTADRLTTPRTISLSSQATGQVSFDGSGNVDIPVTVNELDSKNSNNRDLNSLVTLNGYGGSLFYGMGGNTSVNKPSGVDWFGLFSFKSASGNYTTQILGSNNRLYSRSNADTSLGSWNTIAYLTDNVASATKLQNTRTFTISDGTNSGTASNFDGTGNVTLRLPRTINANIVGDITGDIVGDVIGDLHGNADTATKLQTGRNINGTLFDGTQNITTAQWGTARNIGIVNSDGTGTAVPTSVNGSVNVNLRLPATIKANLQGNVTGDITGNLNGNASTASKLQTARTITLTGDATGSTSFNGSTNVSIAVDVNTASKLATARTITLTGDASGSASFDGSANISIPVTIANDSHTHATSASSNATTNLTITAGGTTATIADLYATYADQLRTARTISLTGDVTGSTSFNGAGNVSIATTVANNSHNHTFANISDKPVYGSWQQNNNNNITTSQFLDLLETAGAFTYGWFHTRGSWSYTGTSNIIDTGYGTIDLAGCAITVWGSSKSNCTILIIPPLNSSVSPSVELGNMYIYVNNGDGFVSGWRKIARFEDIDWSKITNKPSSFTPSSHTHTISQISNLNASWDSLLANAPSAYLTRWPSISEVTGKQNLTIRLNGGTIEGTNQFTYNGTTAKTLSITPSNIGAAASSHTHTISQISGLQAELNSKLESVSLTDLGITATAAEINKLDGLATTATELGYVHGVTSNIQTQLDARMLAGSGKGYNIAYSKKINFNGTEYYFLGTTATAMPAFYAPASAGTSGQWLKATGAAPIWSNDGEGCGLDADMLDGHHANYFRDGGELDWDSTYAASILHYNNNSVGDNPYSLIRGNQATVIQVIPGNTSQYGAQLAIGFGTNRLAWRGRKTNEDGTYGWGTWREITAGSADIATSATKLATARTLWGQPFDGTQNVQGKMAKMLGFYANNDETWSDGTNEHYWYGYDTHHNTGVFSTTISDYFGMCLRTGQGYLSMLDNGNVGIGTTTPSYKLDVNGNGRFLSELALSSTLTAYGLATFNGGIKVNSIINQEYYHRLDLGGYDSNQWDFYEYGGAFNFYKNTVGTQEGAVKIFSILGDKVGVGNVTPTYNLHVIGTGYFSSSLSLDSTLTTQGLATFNGGVKTNTITLVNGSKTANISLDADGNIHTTACLYSEADCGSGAGINEDDLWTILGRASDNLIDESHIPSIGTSKVTGLDTSLSALSSSISTNASAIQGNTAKISTLEAYFTNGVANNADMLKPDVLYGGDLNDIRTEGKLYYAGGSNSVTNKPSGVDAFGMMSLRTASGWFGQLLMSSNTATGLYWRTQQTYTDDGWRKVLDSKNYTDYTVTKTGEGASGTWNINISGTAASANSVAWANVSGKPSSFTPSSHTHTASQVSGLAKVATSGSYNDLSNKPTIPSLAGYATQSWVQSQGYLTTPYTLPIASASTLGGVKIGSGVNISSGVISVSCSSIGAATSDHTHSNYLTSASLSGYATQSWVNSQGFIKSATDTKNTAGSTNNSSKLFLIGATSQATSPITYSNVSVYTQSGQLYASQMNATNGFFETSDARLKDFKEDIKALDTVDQIPTKYFTWKEDKNKESQIGTSAQEVEKLYPELVSKTEDNTLTVDYAKLSIIALAAIKELKTEIQSLKEEIKQLKSK